MLLNAAGRALRREVANRVRRIREAGDSELTLAKESDILFAGAPVARLIKGPDPLSPRLEVLASDFVEQAERVAVMTRLTAFTEAQLRRALGPLFRLKDALAASDRDPAAAPTGLARGIAFRLVEALGAMPREAAVDDLRKLAPQERWQLRSLGVKFGEASLFIPAMLKPGVTRHRLMCWRIFSAACAICRRRPRRA